MVEVQRGLTASKDRLRTKSRLMDIGLVDENNCVLRQEGRETKSFIFRMSIRRSIFAEVVYEIWKGGGTRGFFGLLRPRQQRSICRRFLALKLVMVRLLCS
ncbi:hypothetical protein Dimus_009115 [Dionaea muscipula]